MASYSCTCTISLSDFAERKIPELKKIFKDIKDQRHSLEIVGVLKVAGGSESECTLAVTVKKSDFESVQHPGTKSSALPK